MSLEGLCEGRTSPGCVLSSAPLAVGQGSHFQSGDTCRERYSPVSKKPKLPPEAGNASKQKSIRSPTVSGSPSP